MNVHHPTGAHEQDGRKATVSPTRENGLVMRRSWVRFPQAAPSFPQVRANLLPPVCDAQADLSGMSSSCQRRRVAETRRTFWVWTASPPCRFDGLLRGGGPCPTGTAGGPRRAP